MNLSETLEYCEKAAESGNYPATSWYSEAAKQAAALEARVEGLEGALVKALKLIMVWHNMGMSEENGEIAWAIYLKNAPELKPILKALAGKDSSTSPEQGARHD